ncbi:hypothetical protein B0J14DRAFT_638900 [Halenospora varia]|nr:hypothetical protein B0J14DRAFT_638900 [Halenospora varia]
MALFPLLLLIASFWIISVHGQGGFSWQSPGQIIRLELVLQLSTSNIPAMNPLLDGQKSIYAGLSTTDGLGILNLRNTLVWNGTNGGRWSFYPSYCCAPVYELAQHIDVFPGDQVAMDWFLDPTRLFWKNSWRITRPGTGNEPFKNLTIVNGSVTFQPFEVCKVLGNCEPKTTLFNTIHVGAEVSGPGEVYDWGTITWGSMSIITEYPTAAVDGSWCKQLKPVAPLKSWNNATPSLGTYVTTDQDKKVTLAISFQHPNMKSLTLLLLFIGLYISSSHSQGNGSRGFYWQVPGKVRQMEMSLLLSKTNIPDKKIWELGSKLISSRLGSIAGSSSLMNQVFWEGESWRFYPASQSAAQPAPVSLAPSIQLFPGDSLSISFQYIDSNGTWRHTWSVTQFSSVPAPGTLLASAPATFNGTVNFDPKSQCKSSTDCVGGGTFPDYNLVAAEVYTSGGATWDWGPVTWGSLLIIDRIHTFGGLQKWNHTKLSTGTYIAPPIVNEACCIEKATAIN